jgi:hypothetical protein
MHMRNGGQTIDTDLDQSDDTFQETDSGGGIVIALMFFVTVTVTAFFVGFFTG